MNLRRKNQSIIESSSVNIYKYNFNNKNVCISGTIPGYTRTQAIDRLKKLFKTITIHSQVKSTTDILITGHGLGQTKLNAAKKYGVRIVDSTGVFT